MRGEQEGETKRKGNRTENKISGTQTLHCSGYFDTIVDNNSIKFCVVDEGAPPAKPTKTARVIALPCVCMNALP